MPKVDGELPTNSVTSRRHSTPALITHRHHLTRYLSSRYHPLSSRLTLQWHRSPAPTPGQCPHAGSYRSALLNHTQTRYSPLARLKGSLWSNSRHCFLWILSVAFLPLLVSPLHRPKGSHRQIPPAPPPSAPATDQSSTHPPASPPRTGHRPVSPADRSQNRNDRLKLNINNIKGA